MAELKGSTALPPVIELIDGVKISQQTLITYAHAESGLSADKWNSLNDGGRDEWLRKAAARLEDLAEDDNLPESVKTLGDAPADKPAKAAAEIDETHHLHPDYKGPLTGDQALRRHESGLVEERIKAHKPTPKAKG